MPRVVFEFALVSYPHDDAISSLHRGWPKYDGHLSMHAVFRSRHAAHIVEHKFVPKGPPGPIKTHSGNIIVWTPDSCVVDGRAGDDGGNPLMCGPLSDPATTKI